MKLTFYNHYGNGDLFESREFVLDWMRLAGVTEAGYAHRDLPGIFADLPQIHSLPVHPEMDMRRSLTRRPDDELWVNTWIGRDSGYVVNPGIGCVVEEIYRMHQDMLREAGLPPLPRPLVEYLPTIDYTRIELGRLHSFLSEHRHEKLALICNGPTGSGQAENFDLAAALPEPRPDRRFLLTQGHPQMTQRGADQIEGRPDVLFTDDLTGRPPGGWDLNAISYLSRFCDVIVGRCSGPQMFTQVRPNWEDGSKTQVCFTHHRNGACFVLHPERLGLRMKVIWSPAATPAAAGDVLRGIL